ncbi:MAG: DUF1801 domain-containing protein [Schleiferiaceae bacterium]
MAKKGGMPVYSTVNEYIAAQNPSAQALLKELEELILEAAPDAEPLTDIKAPSYTLVPGGKREHQIMTAAYAKFVSFYPFPTTTEAFADELSGFKQGKGSIQFPFDKPLPRDLIVRMVKFRKAELSQ